MSTSLIEYITEWVLHWMKTSLDEYFTEWKLHWKSTCQAICPEGRKIILHISHRSHPVKFFYNNFPIYLSLFCIRKIKMKIIINILNSTFTYRKYQICIKKLLNNYNTQLFSNNFSLRLKERQITETNRNIYALSHRKSGLHFFTSTARKNKKNTTVFNCF